MKKGILFLLGVFVLLIIFVPSYSVIQDKRRRNLEYDRKIEELSQSNSDLIREERLLREDSHYLEKVAREKMGLVKEGEVVVDLSMDVVK